jgi:hypothetical protein
MAAKKSIPKHERGVAKLAELVPAAYNPRKIDKAAKRALAKSLERYGVVQDVVVNRRTGNIVGGHQRVDALLAVGETEVPVVWVDLDDKDERALNILLNSPKLSGAFDDRLLNALLVDLQAEALPEFAELRLDDLLKEMPTFKPIEEPTAKLDERGMTTCPKCGHEF